MTTRPKPICAAVVIVFSAAVLFAQSAIAPAADASYLDDLVRLVTRLQQNPWSRWDVGTSVTMRYFVERDKNGHALGREQPDVVFRVTECDERFETTQVVKGKEFKREFAIKDQVGLDAPRKFLTEGVPSYLVIDGLRLDCVRRESTLFLWGMNSTWVTKEWRLSGQPSITLRAETNGNGWQITSARITRTVAGKEFSCVEIKKAMNFYSGGPALSETTQYLCPEVPGHLTEQIDQFFKIKKGLKSSTPFQVVHQKVVDIKPTLSPNENR